MPKRMIIANSVRPVNASRAVGRSSTSAWEISVATGCSPAKEPVHRLDDGLEEVRFALAEEGEGFTGVADERPQDPGHLRADQAEDDDPDAEDGAHARVEHARLHPLQRAGRRIGRRHALGWWLERFIRRARRRQLG